MQIGGKHVKLGSKTSETSFSVEDRAEAFYQTCFFSIFNKAL